MKGADREYARRIEVSRKLKEAQRAPQEKPEFSAALGRHAWMPKHRVVLARTVHVPAVIGRRFQRLSVLLAKRKQNRRRASFVAPSVWGKSVGE